MGTVPMGTGRVLDDFLANAGNVAAGGEVHHRVGAVVHGAVEFFEFFGHVGGGGGIADVGVDLAQEGDADAHRFEVAMMDVRGNDGAAARHFAADEFGVNFLAAGDVFHFLGDDALAGVVHLREIADAAVHARGRFSIQAISDCHKLSPPLAR
jgi:hypothetical protein